MKFGISYAYYQDARQVQESAKLIESSGYDSLWVTENVHSGPEALEPMVVLSQYAAYTERISIGPAVVLLPLRNPVGFAHAVATIDHLSEGRFILGVGAGGNAVEGYEAYGVPVAERGKRCNETLEIMTNLWSGEPYTFDGQFTKFSNYTLGAGPFQRPHPPIWLGGDAPPVLRRAGRWGDGFFPAHTHPAETAEMFRKVDGYRREWGREDLEFTNAIYLYLHFAESGEKAQAEVRATLGERYTYPVSHVHAGVNAVIGTPEDCVRVLKEYEAIGVTHAILDPACPKDQLSATVERAAREVMPHFK